ncbi:MAG: hypothetical protein J7501_13880 [Bdellovibrio sp.]|nr:hypothetical protein [Bdellovibrio sp.]
MQTKKSLSLLIFLSLFIASSGFALDQEIIPSKPHADLEDELIKSNLYISRFVDNMADGLDLFLAGKQYTTAQNPTSVTLESWLYYSEKEAFKEDFAFNLNLRLPNLEEYWQVTFTNYDETAERGVAQTYIRTQPRTKDYGASVGFFTQLGEVKTTFQPRVSFSGWLKISHTLTFESIVQRGKNYRINPKLQFYADADQGTGSFQGLNFNFVLSKYYNLTLVNEGDYQGRDHNYNVTNGIAVGQWFSSTSNISYNMFANFTNRPNYQLTAFSLSTSFSQILYKNILDYQVVPNLSWAEKHGYAANPGINMRVSLKF